MVPMPGITAFAGDEIRVFYGGTERALDAAGNVLRAGAGKPPAEQAAALQALKSRWPAGALRPRPKRTCARLPRSASSPRRSPGRPRDPRPRGADASTGRPCRCRSRGKREQATPDSLVSRPTNGQRDAPRLDMIVYGYDRQRELVEARTLDVARALAQTVDRELARYQAAMLALATSPHLTSGDLAAFHRQAGHAMPRPAGRHLRSERCLRPAARQYAAAIRRAAPAPRQRFPGAPGFRDRQARYFRSFRRRGGAPAARCHRRPGAPGATGWPTPSP